MMWVKGELLTDLDAPGVDPTAQLERAAQPALFDRRDWFRRVRRYGEGAVLICRAASEGALCWLFLKRDGTATVSALSNGHSFAFRPIYSGSPDPERQRAMLVAIARRIRMARPRIASLTLSPVPDSDGGADLLQNALRSAGWSSFRKATSLVNWTAATAGQSFETYWEARPGHLRDAFTRTLAGARFDTQVFTRFDSDAWQAFEEACRDSGTAEGALPGFLREMAVAESEAGSLRLGLCRIDEAIVAAQFWTVENGVARIHGIAEHQAAARHSPGLVLSAAMFHHAIEDDKAERIDFVAEADQGMAAWMGGASPLIRLEAYNPATLAGRWGAFKARLGALVRRSPKLA